MNHSSISILLAIATASGCTKSKTDIVYNTPPVESRTIQVLEKSTNKPVAGAIVYLKKCTRYDNVFGCLGYTTHTTLTSNNSGHVTISASAPVDAIEVQHNNYWTYNSKSVSNITLTPKSIIEVSIKRINPYAHNDILYIGQHVADCYPPTCYPHLEPIGLPSDTVVFFKGAGYTDNQISWYINYLTTDTLHSSPSFYITGFDSSKVNIRY